MDALQSAVANMSTLGWLQLLSLASLSLYALCKAIRRRSKPSRRLSLAPLQSVLCEKVLPSKDLPDAISSVTTLSAHGKRPSSSLIRRTTSISGRSRVVTPPTESGISDAAFPSTLQDIGTETKIKSLADYVASQDASTSTFCFRTEQAIRLAKLSDVQLDEFWIDLQFECLRRAGLHPVHQVLAYCPNLAASRLEAIRRMAAIDQQLFVEMVQDLLYELQRRQRQSDTAVDQRQPHPILARKDVDWKGHDTARFGKLVLDEPGLVTIERDAHSTRRHSSRRPHQIFLFERIFLAFRPTDAEGNVAPVLKGRVFVKTLSKLSGSTRNGEYRLHITFGAAPLPFSRSPAAEAYTLCFEEEATYAKWANELRDAVVGSQLGDEAALRLKRQAGILPDVRR